MTSSTNGLCICGCEQILTGRRKKYASAECSKRAGREKHLMTCFGITPQEYDRILAEQDGKCGICKRPPKANKRLAVDHRHTDGRAGPVTGLLCFVCNKRFLGARKEEIIVAMYEYITNPPAERAGVHAIAHGRPKKARKRPVKRQRGKK